MGTRINKRQRNAPTKRRTTKTTKKSPRSVHVAALTRHASDGEDKGRIRTGIRRAKQADDAQVEHARETSYDAWKSFEGQRYTGMKIGSHHKWYYDQGIWKERKMTPDEWTFDFAVKKRRAGKAPKGSGVPVGTEYHWYILGHQYVKKLNANIYSTALSGIKFKAAHKRARSEKWSVTEHTQKKRIIRFLQGMIKDLQQQVDREEKEAKAAKSKK